MSLIPDEILKRLKSGELIPAIAQNNLDNQVLMLAYMNEEALEKTIETKFATYWSRDRKSTRLNSSHIPLSRMPSSA